MIRLYKYRPFNSYLEPIIISQKIWFPTRAKLNDLEDLELNLIDDVDAEVYRRFLLKKAHDESWPSKHLKYNFKKGFNSKGNLTSEARQKMAGSRVVLQNYFDGLGILSLSEKENSPILWERYGDQEKGVCITFKMELSNHLLKVEYETPRPQLKLSDLILLSRADAEKQILKVLKTKATKWADESEWRYFLREGNTEFPFLGMVEAVTLGRKISDANRQKIIEWAAKSEKTISVKNM